MTGPPKVTLQHLLSRPLHHREEQLVRANRINFPGHEETLHKHLQRLGLIGLARYLVWVPFDSFNYVSHVEVRGGGGTSVVYHGIMRWLPLNFAFVRDADDMRTSEYDDLRIAGTEFETQPEELNPPQYEDLAPPEYPICFKNEGIRRDYVLREFDASMVDESIIFDCWNPDPRGRPTAEAVRERILLAYQKRPVLFSSMTRNFIKDRREAHLDQLERDLFDITKADAAWADAWARSDDIDLEKAYRKL
ncbi:hypothetical protein BC938DRAFT_480913, partial [Jimgerdemannia flammicorona]